jgi:hypothetical protein
LNMNKHKIHNLIIIFTAMVWLANGLLCKLIGLVPRHELIVARILGPEHSFIITKIIGVSEILMALWILSQKMKNANAFTQIIVIATMNTLEFLLAPDLLLWGKANALFAAMFILLIWYNQFKLGKLQVNSI